jgi:hypothetical protein
MGLFDRNHTNSKIIKIGWILPFIANIIIAFSLWNVLFSSVLGSGTYIIWIVGFTIFLIGWLIQLILTSLEMNNGKETLLEYQYKDVEVLSILKRRAQLYTIGSVFLIFSSVFLYLFDNTNPSELFFIIFKVGFIIGYVFCLTGFKMPQYSTASKCLCVTSSILIVGMNLILVLNCVLYLFVPEVFGLIFIIWMFAETVKTIGFALEAIILITSY